METEDLNLGRFCSVNGAMNCKHASATGRGSPQNPVCEAPQNIVRGVVDEAKYLATGVPQLPVDAYRHGSCHSARREAPNVEMLEMFCGPQGIWFEPKEKGA